MAKVLIIGYGNPLRGDDALGWHAAERLRAEVSDPGVEIRAVHQLTPELAEPISQAGLVIFLDARQDGEPGALHSEPVHPQPLQGGFSHHAGPEALLAASAALYGARPPALLISITGGSFAFGTELSPAVQAALPELIAACRRSIGELR